MPKTHTHVYVYFWSKTVLLHDYSGSPFAGGKNIMSHNGAFSFCGCGVDNEEKREGWFIYRPRIYSHYGQEIRPTKNDFRQGRT
jgi:hypothetical protein